MFNLAAVLSYSVSSESIAAQFVGLVCCCLMLAASLRQNTRKPAIKPNQPTNGSNDFSFVLGIKVSSFNKLNSGLVYFMR